MPPLPNQEISITAILDAWLILSFILHYSFLNLSPIYVKYSIIIRKHLTFILFSTALDRSETGGIIYSRLVYFKIHRSNNPFTSFVLFVWDANFAETDKEYLWPIVYIKSVSKSNHNSVEQQQKKKEITVDPYRSQNQLHFRNRQDNCLIKLEPRPKVLLTTHSSSTFCWHSHQNCPKLGAH